MPVSVCLPRAEHTVGSQKFSVLSHNFLHDQPRGVLHGFLNASASLEQRRPVWAGHKGWFCCCGHSQYVTGGLMLSRAKGTQFQEPDGCF